jgi:predicted DsbA family dithiol-disulfide isomerase
VRLAHQFALESDQVTADMVEISEFPALAERYGVRSVPHMVVNHQASFVGSLPESKFLEQVKTALAAPPETNPSQNP